MAKLQMRPAPKKEDREACIAFLQAYKAQNPKKYADKKEALFKQFGLDEREVDVDTRDEHDKELDSKLAKAKAKNAK